MQSLLNLEVLLLVDDTDWQQGIHPNRIANRLDNVNFLQTIQVVFEPSGRIGPISHNDGTVSSVWDIMAHLEND